MLGADDPEKLIIATYLETQSILETAKKLNYSFSWIYRILNKFKVVNSKPKNTKKLNKNLSSKISSSLIADYLAGKHTSLILSKYNISSTTLYFILNQNKIIRRNKGKNFNWANLSKEEKAYLSATIICYAQQGKSLQGIAKELEIPFSRVRNIINTLTIRGAICDNY